MMVPELYLDEYLEDEAFLDELLRLVERGGAPQAVERRGGPRLWKALSNVIFYTALALACVAALFYATNAGERGAKDIAGFYIFNVLTPSMQREIPKGSLILVRRTDPGSIEQGQTITFFAGQGGRTKTHKVIGITEDFEGSGSRGFETQGVENDSPDFEINRAENVVGVVKFHIPLLGGALQYMKDNPKLMLLWFGGLLALSFFLRIALGKPRFSRRKSSD